MLHSHTIVAPSIDPTLYNARAPSFQSLRSLWQAESTDSRKRYRTSDRPIDERNPGSAPKTVLFTVYWPPFTTQWSERLQWNRGEGKPRVSILLEAWRQAPTTVSHDCSRAALHHDAGGQRSLHCGWEDKSRALLACKQYRCAHLKSLAAAFCLRTHLREAMAS